MLVTNTIKYCREHMRIDIAGPADIHTHGCMGVDFTTAKPEEIAGACRYYAEKGIAGIMPAVMTAPADVMLSACRRIAKAAELVEEWNAENREDAQTCQESGKVYRYARIIGINLEGPFISKERSGAQPKDSIQPVSESFLDECRNASGGMVRLMTIAPELCGALDFIDRNHSDSLHFSLGHTDCGYAAAREAFLAGADQLTHAFNAMRGIHHREPGPVMAAIDSGAYIELICDGIHIDPRVVSMMERLCGEKLIPVSDSVMPCGLPDGSYPGFVKCGHRICLENGGLAGGGIFLTEGLGAV